MKELWQITMEEAYEEDLGAKGKFIRHIKEQMRMYEETGKNSYCDHRQILEDKARKQREEDQQ